MQFTEVKQTTADLNLGPGRNDGILRVYSAVRAENRLREFSWNGSSWTISDLPVVPESLIHNYMVDGRGDGVVRVYASGGNGNAYEFSWNGSSWVTNILGGGAGYLYGFHYGTGRNDGKIRLYVTYTNKFPSFGVVSKLANHNLYSLTLRPVERLWVST